MRGLGLAMAVAAVGVGCAPPQPGGATSPVRAALLGDPQVGSFAPTFTLPYVLPEGPGPVDQPFVLRAELGRVVVLALLTETTDSGSVALVQGLVRNRSGLGEGTQVAVAVPLGIERAVEYANRHGLQDKVLADSTGSVRRLYGISQGGSGLYVVDPTGRIVWRDIRVNAFSAVTYQSLRQAAIRAGTGNRDW